MNINLKKCIEFGSCQISHTHQFDALHIFGIRLDNMLSHIDLMHGYHSHSIVAATRGNQICLKLNMCSRYLEWYFCVPEPIIHRIFRYVLRHKPCEKMKYRKFIRIIYQPYNRYFQQSPVIF